MAERLVSSPQATPVSGPSFTKTLIIFTLYGPLFGGSLPYLVVLAEIFGNAAGYRSAWYGIAFGFVIFAFIGLVFAFPYLYIFGTVPAVLAGLVIALWERKHGAASRRFTIATGAVTGILSAAAFVFIVGYRPLWPEVSDIPLRGLLISNISILPFAIVASSIFAALACVRISRWRRKAQSGNSVTS
jgi:hypothetical protein